MARKKRKKPPKKNVFIWIHGLLRWTRGFPFFFFLMNDDKLRKITKKKFKNPQTSSFPNLDLYSFFERRKGILRYVEPIPLPIRPLFFLFAFFPSPSPSQGVFFYFTIYSNTDYQLGSYDGVRSWAGLGGEVNEEKGEREERGWVVDADRGILVRTGEGLGTGG